MESTGTLPRLRRVFALAAVMLLTAAGLTVPANAAGEANIVGSFDADTRLFKDRLDAGETFEITVDFAHAADSGREATGVTLDITRFESMTPSAARGYVNGALAAVQPVITNGTLTWAVGTMPLGASAKLVIDASTPNDARIDGQLTVDPFVTWDGGPTKPAQYKPQRDCNIKRTYLRKSHCWISGWSGYNRMQVLEHSMHPSKPKTMVVPGETLTLWMEADLPEGHLNNYKMSFKAPDWMVFHQDRTVVGGTYDDAANPLTLSTTSSGETWQWRFDPPRGGRIVNPVDGDARNDQITVAVPVTVTKGMVPGPFRVRFLTQIGGSHPKIGYWNFFARGPQVEITASADPDPVLPGDRTTFTVVAKNTDAAATANDTVVRITDIPHVDVDTVSDVSSTCGAVPASGMTFALGTVEPGAQCTITFTARVPRSTDGAGVVAEAEWFSVPSGVPGAGDVGERVQYAAGPVRHDVTLADTDIDVQLTAVTPDIKRGAIGRVNMVVTNRTAPGFTLTDVPITFTYPDGVNGQDVVGLDGDCRDVRVDTDRATAVISSIPPDGSVTCQLVVRIAGDVPQSVTSLTVHGEAVAPDGVVEPSDATLNVSGFDVPVDGPNVVDPPDVLVAWRDVPARVGVGSEQAVALVVTNQGGADVAGFTATASVGEGAVVESCDVPAGSGLTCTVAGRRVEVRGAALAKDATVVVSLRLRTGLDVPDSRRVELAAEVLVSDGSEPAETLANNTTKAWVSLFASPDLAITLATNTPVLNRGGAATLTAGVSQSGRLGVGDGVVTIVAPEATEFVRCRPECDSSAFPKVVWPSVGLADSPNAVMVAGAASPPMVVVRAVADRDVYTATARIDVLPGVEAEVNLGNNAASVSMTHTDAPAVDLHVDVTNGTPSVGRGDPVDYSFTVSNSGYETVTQITFTHRPADGLGNVTYEPSEGSYDPATGVWSGLDLGPGESVSLRVRARVTSSIVGSLVSLGEASPFSGVDATPEDNEGTSTVNVGGSPNSSGSPGGAHLSRTGAPLADVAGWGVVLVLAGAWLVALRRRRPAPTGVGGRADGH